MGKTSSAVKDRYNAKVYEEIKLRVSRGSKGAIQAHAEARGESVNGFINRAISETMERDGPTRPQEAAGAALGVGAALPSEAVKTAQRAAE